MLYILSLVYAKCVTHLPITVKFVLCESNEPRGLLAVHVYEPVSSESTDKMLKMEPSVSNRPPSLVHSTEGIGKPFTPQDIVTLFPLIVRTVLPTTASIDLGSRTSTSSIPVRMISGGVGT